MSHYNLVDANIIKVCHAYIENECFFFLEYLQLNFNDREGELRRMTHNE